jgi:glucokinase
MTWYIGIDVGGTKCAAVLLDGRGGMCARDWTEHEGEWQGRVVDTVMASIERLLARARVDIGHVGAIGVAAAGLVGRDRSTLVHSPIIRETHVDLGGLLAAATGLPVTVENDANATLAAIAGRERWRDGPRPEADRVVILVTLGTGLGGAVMVGDRILAGEHGFAAELGHIVVDPGDERTCACGSRGCVEQFASGRGLEELARLLPRPAGATAVATLGVTGPSSARDIVSAAASDDVWAAQLISLAGTMLGRAISILGVVLDPTRIIVGGTLGHAAWPWLRPAAEAEMRRRWTYPAERPLPDLVLDPIGPYAAATGAGLLAAAIADKDDANG